MARSLARRAAAGGLEGATVLEIGGGIGQVLLELLEAGAREGEVVELVPSYESHARSSPPKRASASARPSAPPISSRIPRRAAKPTSSS